MAFNPFGQSSLAQSIIDSKLTNITSSTPMQPQDMNTNNVFRNPYSPTGFYANDTDVNPKPSFTPPTTDDQGNKQCDNFEGYYYDPISDSCKLIVPETMNDNDREETKTFSERAYDSMARDVTDPYGSSNEIQKYFNEDMSNNSVNGDKYYDFNAELEPTPLGPLVNFGIGFVDKLFGGPKNRTNRFNTAVNTMLSQTPKGFEMGKMLNDNRLQMFGGKSYLDRVGNLNVNGNRNIDNLLRSMENAELNRSNKYDVSTGTYSNEPQQGTPIAKDMSGSTITGYSLRNDDGTRNDTNYQATVAKNIARNMEKNKDSNRGGNASKFSEKLGGFYGGR